jgi:diguanylate cyclase (GGDEF)-like protein/PAS domain S-box-containing protein
MTMQHEDKSANAPDTGGAPDLEPFLPEFGRLLLHASPQPMIAFDEDGTVQLFNVGAETIFGQSADQAVGSSLEQFLPDFSGFTVRVAGGRHAPGPDSAVWLRTRTPVRARQRGGRLFPTEVSVARLAVGGRVLYTALVTDLTEYRDRERELESLAYFDAVTRLPNRAHFDRRLKQALGRAECVDSQFAVLFIDFDRFKSVNDALGHSAGDRVLQVLGERLASALRPQDSLARHGGDEFVVLLEDLDTPTAVEPVANRILATLRNPIRLEGYSFDLSVSIGIATYPASGGTDEALLKAADGAMYHAKGRGGRRYVYAAHGGTGGAEASRPHAS